jgi:hypothetical protein
VFPRSIGTKGKQEPSDAMDAKKVEQPIGRRLCKAAHFGASFADNLIGSHNGQTTALVENDLMTRIRRRGSRAVSLPCFP